MSEDTVDSNWGRNAPPKKKESSMKIIIGLVVGLAVGYVAGDGHAGQWAAVAKDQIHSLTSSVDDVPEHPVDAPTGAPAVQ